MCDHGPILCYVPLYMFFFFICSSLSLSPIIDVEALDDENDNDDGYSVPGKGVVCASSTSARLVLTVALAMKPDP